MFNKKAFWRSVGYDKGSLGQFLTFSLVIIALGYLSIKWVASLWGESLATWVFVLGVVVFYVIALLAKFMTQIGADYYTRQSGIKGKANLAALDMATTALLIGFAGTRAMVAYQIDRFDNLVMWCGLAIIFLRHIFLEIRKIKINELAHKAGSHIKII